MQRLLAAVVVLVPLTFFTACGGVTQSNGDRSADASATSDAGSATDANGLDTTTIADLDTPCLGGPTGRKLLGMLLPSYSSTFTAEGPPAGYSWKGSLAPTSLLITQAYQGGAITCTKVGCPCDPPGPCGECKAPPQLAVDVEMTFKTADGAFDEHVKATATLIDYPGQPNKVTLGASIAAKDLKGTYAPIFSRDETFEIGGYFAGPTTSGAVSELLPQKISGGGGAWGN